MKLKSIFFLFHFSLNLNYLYYLIYRRSWNALHKKEQSFTNNRKSLMPQR